MSESNVKQNPYESLFIVPPETAQSTVEAFNEKLKALITEKGGSVRSVQVWGRRRLAYPIQQHRDGVYIYVDYDAPSGTSSAVENLFRVNDFIIRDITVVREDPPILERPAGEGAPEAEAAQAPSEAAPENVANA